MRSQVVMKRWFVVRGAAPGAGWGFVIAGFLAPLLLWCAVSYVPWLWHPEVLIDQPGGSQTFAVGMRVPVAAFAAENAALAAAGAAPVTGQAVNPVFLPAPHAVAVAFVTAFTTPPRRTGDPWLHESLLHSCALIAQGFGLAILIGVPLGILCGAYAGTSRLVEPFTDFLRYLPAPAFGALAVAIFGISDGPKVAIIVLATVLPTILVIANTTRSLDKALIDAAATLGASNRQVLLRVVLPGIAPAVWNDLRILLGAAWTTLIVAELIGQMSGISFFINQQGKYRNYDFVFVGIIAIGVVGLVTDQILAAIGRLLFPWKRAS